jgi:PAS domain S-box-containing protein
MAKDTPPKKAPVKATSPTKRSPARGRKGIEDSLLKSEERFRILVQEVKDYAIVMLDPGGHVVSWNAGAERIKGYRAEEILGQHFSTFYPREDVERGKTEMELRVAASEGRFEDEGWRVRKDGSRFWADVVITALRDHDDQLVGFVKVTRDLTDRLRAQEERLRLAHAEEAIRLRDEFLSIASHELRTPLTALQLQLESLEEQTAASAAKLSAKVAGAVRSSQRLGVLIDSLLDVSRIATGQLSLSPHEMDLRQSLELLLDGLRDSADRAGARLDLEGESSLWGEWDEVRLEQLVTNLVANAIKYGGGQPIVVRLARDGDAAVIEVRDHGPGIQPGDMERIFERFERASSRRHHGGFGLGLYVAREIARAHGGSIDVRNAEGGGACFRVRLPLVTRKEEVAV